jgi:hypothetical protein
VTAGASVEREVVHPGSLPVVAGSGQGGLLLDDQVGVPEVPVAAVWPVLEPARSQASRAAIPTAWWRGRSGTHSSTS